MRALVLVLAVGCARPAPQGPQPAIADELSCFVVESDGGAGIVCTERAAACKTIQGLTSTADGVRAISECRRAMVTVNVEE